jgi:hypothetical protein
MLYNLYYIGQNCILDTARPVNQTGGSIIAYIVQLVHPVLLCYPYFW